MKIIDRETVENVLTMERCIKAVKDAMIALTEQTVSVPPRVITPLMDELGYFGLMPGSASFPAFFGAKVVSLFPQNPAKGLPAIQGFVCLFDNNTGAPYALVEGASVTAIRTAAASGLATDLLARPESKTHAIFGTGVQAKVHAEAIKTVRPDLEKTIIWGRDPEKARQVSDQISIELEIETEATSDPEAAAECDIISTVTGSSEPILKGAWLRPGTHINLVGAHSQSTREADSEVITKSQVYVDLMESAKNEAGDLLIPVSEGIFSLDNIIGEIGSLARGKIEGRGSAEEITCYKSLGVVAQDLFAANAVLENI